MRRRVVLPLIWLAAAALASTVTWQGVQIVSNQVLDTGPASPLPDVAGQTSTTTAPEQQTGSLDSTTRPTSPPTTETSPQPTDSQTVTKTFPLVGGTTAISFSPTEVIVIYANPNDGFSVKIEPEGAGIKVEFEGDHHESRVEAWWDNGPQSGIRERPE